MKLLGCVYLLVVGGLLAAPCFSAEKTMKHEPKTIEGLACGDTPFKSFTPFEFLGREQNAGCPRVYRKSDVLYNFNSRGQLYQIQSSCDAKSIKAFTKKHGKPTSLQKSGNDRYEGKLFKWDGKNVEAVFYTTTSNLPGNMDICMANYYCKKIEATEKGECNDKELVYQAQNVDQFVKSLGNNVDFKELDKTADRKTAELVAIFDKNAKTLGLPKSETTSFEIRDDVINTVCMTYKKTEGSLIKKILHEKVGDISEDINNPIFTGTGKGTSIEYLDWDKASFTSSVGVRVCFTGVRG